jgi:hypothetical protein
MKLVSKKEDFLTHMKKISRHILERPSVNAWQ